MIKELKNEETIVRKGDKFIFTQIREIELAKDDLLSIATNNRMKVDSLKQEINQIKKNRENAVKFLVKNKRVIEEAKNMEELRYCEKCAMDFDIKENKKFRSQKVKAPYKALCRKCAEKEGI